MRDLIDVLNEAFNAVHVDSSHIDTIEHNGEHLYVRFLDGALYEYDDVDEEMAREMLRSPSKGRFMWQNIRDTKPYRRVDDVPPGKEPTTKQNVSMSYDEENDTWVDNNAEPKVQQVQDWQSVEVPKGYQFRAPDGDTYIWHGAQWGNTRTGRVANRAIRDKITDVAKRLIKLKGDEQSEPEINEQ